VPVKIITDGNGQMQWNTDPLFATANRKDLIGQLATSTNPGEGGNTVLLGHNYDWGIYEWEAVFVSINKLQPGDTITVYTTNGGKFYYTVQQVKKVPWQSQSETELAKHQKYFFPTDHEQLTLITCGGADIVDWNARIYVVALPQANKNP
jgi:LPXTG-site transpeptidase (sortase) family protein